jgi:hypothetical protein
MKSQGMQKNQQVVFMSDGGENVRRVQEYVHSEKVMPFNSESDSLGISGFAAPGGYRFRETAP